jgi:tetratricopeptide (TPR) repeat protein
VERSLDLDPQEFETRRLLSDVLLARKRVEDALTVLEELHAEGHAVVGELASMEKRAALVKLLRGEREDALGLFCRARAHGLGRAELGSGAQILADAALAEIAQGEEMYATGDLDEARRHFERAVELEPEILAGHNHLGVVCYRLGDDAAAIRHWGLVWEVALEEKLTLPEPVELHLAQAMLRAGEPEAAKAVLRESLQAFPNGAHAEAVRTSLRE